MFALQKKIWKWNYNCYPYLIIVSIQISTLICFCRNTSFLDFYCTNMIFLVCNLGLFEITEWKPIKRGAVWFNSCHSKAVNDKVVSFLNLYAKGSNQKALEF